VFLGEHHHPIRRAPDRSISCEKSASSCSASLN
jgi:hypothetical protein